jgi:glyoxylase-like metal-dependent hydrolase (beta-lactamase superfamily II)
VRIAQSAIEHLPITTFSFGAPLFPGIEPVPLPGHTAGQAGYLLVDPNSEQQFLIGGDVCHNPTLHVSRPEWTTMGDSHPHLVRQTRLQLLSRSQTKTSFSDATTSLPVKMGSSGPNPATDSDL